ncbi:hypothetical protein [Amycolatopsis sp. cmx-4-61]|uniref:hypothetical protein n=1 Tax=Amycolatopsis sp. cmx-4-61 TaxID=2790937 RepID=UPI00397851F3
MGRTLSRVAGVVFAGALATFAAAPTALAQTETSASPRETTSSTSETPTSGSTTSTTAPPSTSVTSTTTPSPRTGGDVKTTEKRIAPKAQPDKPVQAAPKDDYQDNVGHGFVGLGGEGVLVIACAAGRPGEVATQYLTVTGGPDQDEADGRLWNYSVRVVDAPAGTTTAKFSWTCGGVEGNGTVEFAQEQPPTSTVTTTATATSTTSTSPTSPTSTTGTTTSTTTTTGASSSAPASSTAPVPTATSSATSSAPAGNAAPKAQVKVAPKGGVETGFGGTAW